MLALLIALLTAAGPLVWGASGLGAQTFLFLAAVAGICLWLLSRVAVGYLPLPSNRNLAWTAALVAISGVSASWSVAPAVSGPAWRAMLLGLWLFPGVAALSKDGRALVDQSIRAAAWVLVLLAFRQRFSQGGAAVAASLPSPEAFGGLIVMLIPLAAQTKDYLLMAGLGAALCWAGSLGAWLGLSGALLISRRRVGEPAFRLGGAIGFICLVVLYSRLQTPEMLARWRGWSDALAMAMQRPWLGFGPGSFERVLCAVHDPSWVAVDSPRIHLLQTAAECGWLYLAVWTWGLVYSLRRGSPHKRFAAAAALIQSFWDANLATPAAYWLLCYCLASASPETSRGADIPSARKVPCGLLVLALGVGAGGSAWRRWRGEELKAAAQERRLAGAPPDEVAALLDRATHRADDPEVETLRAEVALGSGQWEEAAARLERAARLDPYRQSTWRAMERLWTARGRPDKAADAVRRGQAACRGSAP